LLIYHLNFFYKEQLLKLRKIWWVHAWAHKMQRWIQYSMFAFSLKTSRRECLTPPWAVTWRLKVTIGPPVIRLACTVTPPGSTSILLHSILNLKSALISSSTSPNQVIRHFTPGVSCSSSTDSAGGWVNIGSRQAS
jgi:hypothetical protein